MLVEGYILRKYRAAVIGLGWTGMLYDLAKRPGPALNQPKFDLDSPNRPTPEINIDRKFNYHEKHFDSGNPTSYAEAFYDREEIDLVAGADRDVTRLEVFSKRYQVDRLYTDAFKMLAEVKPDIVAITTNIKGRADLTVAAVESGAKGIVTEKPMANTLEEADRMVTVCREADVPLSCGAISTTHPSFNKAEELIKAGAIGEIISIEVSKPGSQHQNWTYFLYSDPQWVIGIGDKDRHEGGSDEFVGQGMMVAYDGLVTHFRLGAPQLRITGNSGELVHVPPNPGWELWQDIDTNYSNGRVQVPWPGPQTGHYGAIYSVSDVLDCMEGKLAEPKNSGRRVAIALEVEVALKKSSDQGGIRLNLPLNDRSLGINYDWFR